MKDGHWDSLLGDRAGGSREPGSEVSGDPAGLLQAVGLGGVVWVDSHGEWRACVALPEELPAAALLRCARMKGLKLPEDADNLARPAGRRQAGGHAVRLCAAGSEELRVELALLAEAMGEFTARSTGD